MSLRWYAWTEQRFAELRPEIGTIEARRVSLAQAMHRYLRDNFDCEDKTRVMFESLLDYLQIEDG